jgi:hypothetical protein
MEWDVGSEDDQQSGREADGANCTTMDQSIDHTPNTPTPSFRVEREGGVG